MFVLIFVALFVILAVYAFKDRVAEYIQWFKDVQHMRTLPGPPTEWGLGHMRMIGQTEKTIMFNCESEWKFPKFHVQWWGPLMPCLTVGCPEYMKKFQRERGSDPKSSRVYRFFDYWFSGGLLNSNGAYWTRHRKMLTPAFHFDVLKPYVDVFNDVSHILLEVWDPLAQSGEYFEVFEYSSHFTLDVILRCAYTRNMNVLIEREKIPIVHSTHCLIELILLRMSFPLYAFNWIFHLSPAGYRFRHHSKIMHKFTDDLIAKRRDELVKGTTGPKKKYMDFLDILLTAKDKNGVGFTDFEIREEANNFVFGGHDTSASGLSWLLYCLAKYPEHQEICRKEIKDAMGDSDEIAFEDVPKLKYLSLCLKESLRLFPSVPNVHRDLTEEIELDGYRIPKGTWIQMDILGLHNNPAYWKDVEKFDPLRHTPENSKDMDPFVYIPFATGLRNCIGQQFAILELKVTVAHILNRYKVDYDPDHKVERYLSAVLRARNDIKLKLSFLN